MQENKGTVLGVDYGYVRTGLAVCDSSRILASGIGTVREKGMHALADKIVAAATEHNCNLIVIGNPVNMDGSCGFRSEKIKLLKEVIGEKCGIPVELYDERCTTMLAGRYLSATDTRGEKRKKAIDALSAQIILQDYIDKKGQK